MAVAGGPVPGRSHNSVSTVLTDGGRSACGALIDVPFRCLRSRNASGSGVSGADENCCWLMKRSRMSSGSVVDMSSPGGRRDQVRPGY